MKKEYIRDSCLKRGDLGRFLIEGGGGGGGTWPKSGECFHYCMYIMLILLLWNLNNLCVMNHLWPLMLCSLLSFLNTLWFIGTSNVMYSCTSCTQVHELPQSEKNITILENEQCYFKHSHIKYSSTLLTYQVIVVSALLDKCTIISMTTLGY